MTILFALTPRLSLLAPRLRLVVRRETIALAALATVATLALVHERQPRGAAGTAAGWFGQLPAEASTGLPAVAPLTSSSLVVSSAELALPAIPAAPARVRDACDSADNSCVIRPLAVAAPVKRVGVPAEAPRAPTSKRAVGMPKPEPVVQASSKERPFNLLDHLPDASTLGHPFSAAGSLVSGWVRRL